LSLQFNVDFFEKKKMQVEEFKLSPPPDFDHDPIRGAADYVLQR
jgi:hypothetical protein